MTDISIDLVLVHGGLYEGMTASKFWVDTGVVESFTRHGFKVLAPDRVLQPRSWEEEASHLAGEMGRTPSAHLLAASNGCSTAARLAADHPARVRSLVFCWPATAGDPQVDALTRRNLIEAGCTPAIADELLSGGILRGMKERELAPCHCRLVSSLPIHLTITTNTKRLTTYFEQSQTLSNWAHSRTLSRQAFGRHCQAFAGKSPNSSGRRSSQGIGPNISENLCRSVLICGRIENFQSISPSYKK